MSKNLKILPKNHYFRQNPSLAAPAAFLDRTSKCSKLPNLSKNEQKLENTIKKSQFLSKSSLAAPAAFLVDSHEHLKKSPDPTLASWDRKDPEKHSGTIRKDRNGPENVPEGRRMPGKDRKKVSKSQERTKNKEHLMCKFRVFRNKKRRTPVVCFCDCHVVKD